MMYQQSPTKLPGSCFRCGKPGHWANTCPENPYHRSPASRPVTSDHEFSITHHCRCGAGFCVIKISNSLANPNKKYYNCPGVKEMGCGYFKWCEDLKREEIKEIQPKKYPICECEAGVCNVLVEENGVFAGRSYFACHVKKGDGACNFKQWVDDYPETLSMTSEGPVSDQSSVLDEYPSNGAEMQIGAKDIAPEILVEDNQVHMEGEDDEMAPDTPEPHPHHADNIISENLDSIMTTQRNESNDALKNQMQTSQVDNRLLSDTSFSTVVANPPILRKGGLHEGSIMTNAILGSFEKLALHLQNDLITLLESVSPHNYGSMKNEADCTFAALNSLQVDYRQFQLRVAEYIEQATSLARIERIINVDTSPQDLVDHRDSEQQRFEELLKSHHEAKDAFMASNNQLSLLCENASSLDELASCEAENAARRGALLQIAKTMAECKESLQAASQKAEDALQKSEEREMERNAARVAFEMARAQLRN